jgi:homoaconitase/3-isopropylmalate dehydratase large subunit
MMHDQTFWASYEAILKGVRKKVWDADRIVMTIDHGSPARNLSTPKPM